MYNDLLFLPQDLTNRLKEKGFNFRLPISYNGKDTYHHHINPLITQTVGWLRQDKHIDIIPSPIPPSTALMGGEIYTLLIYKERKRIPVEKKLSSISFRTWEDTVCAGIKYVLDENLL